MNEKKDIINLLSFNPGVVPSLFLFLIDDTFKNKNDWYLLIPYPAPWCDF